MLSFHATKVYNTIEGGAICYRVPEIGKKLYELKNFGIKDLEVVDGIGANAKMNEFQAAMGICNLRHIGEEIEKHRILIKNRTDIFGDQLIMDEEDNVIGTDEYLLSNATDISIDNCLKLVESFNGVCYPAHVDRTSNGISATLGDFPPEPKFKCAEFHDKEKISENLEKYRELRDKLLQVSRPQTEQ